MITKKLEVAVLGAGGHLGRSLSQLINKETDWQLSAFSRDPAHLETLFADFQRPETLCIVQNDAFPGLEFDIVLNCVGLGDAGQIAQAGSALMSLTERFDSSILSSLAAAPQCLYVAFSSGSVFGTHLANPIARGQLASIDPATRSASIGYSVAKLNSEIKHRLNPVLNIVDIRLYGYFSRFQPPVGSYLMSDIVYCLREKTTLETGGADLIRDYIHPKDLLQLIVCSAQARPINTALDAYSRAPTGKFALLDRLGDEFGLKYHISDVLSQTATNTRPQYYSTDHAAHELGFEPNFSAIDAVVDECRALLDRKPCG